MTIVKEREIACAVCGTKSTQFVTLSTNSIGHGQYLDTWETGSGGSIQHCQQCQFVSYDLSKCSDDEKEIVQSDGYSNFLLEDIVDLPAIQATHLEKDDFLCWVDLFCNLKEAKFFLASSYIQEKLGKYDSAVWEAISAAWTCEAGENKEEKEASVKCRKEALRLIKKAKKHSQPISPQPGMSEAIEIDLMRRSALFDEARKVIRIAKAIDLDETIARVIDFQEVLIGADDVEAHEIAEATFHSEYGWSLGVAVICLPGLATYRSPYTLVGRRYQT